MVLGSYSQLLVRVVFSTCLASVFQISMPAAASDVIVEDDLNLRELPYGLRHWPANKLLTIKSPLIDAPVGFAYISKSGYKDEGLGSLAVDLLVSPFKILGAMFGGGGKSSVSDQRGRIIANLWVSKQGICSFHTILQKRFFGDGDDGVASQFLNVQRVDIGAGQEIVSVEATDAPRIFRRSDFTFTKCGKDQYKDCPEYTGQEYVLRRDWVLSASSIRALSMMPSKSFKVRYVFPGHTQIDEVSDGASVAKVFSACGL